MSEIDKMARELLASECCRNPGFTVTRWRAERAIRAALLAAPPGWKLVPVEPTPEMWAEAGQLGVPYPSHSDYYRAMVAAAPEPK